MLTKVSSRSPRLGRLSLTLLKEESNASLTGNHVVGMISSSAGEWLFPNGSSVPTQESAAVFYRNRGDDGSVSLNVLSSDTVLPLLTGVFCCVVPDATNTVQTACVDISKFLS